MNQSRLGSLIEVWTNIGIGFTINLCASFVVYPLFGAEFSIAQNLGIAVIFTVIAVIRGYVIRRWFNARLHAASLRMAERLDA